jgi:DNA-binding GntR family transcriptional regulator
VAERDTERPTQLSTEWAQSHGEFHRALVAGCPNQWLLRMHQILYQQSERYRQLSAPLAMTERDVKGEHQALVDAVLNKDIETAQALIAEHLDNTAQLLLNSPHLALSPADAPTGNVAA